MSKAPIAGGLVIWRARRDSNSYPLVRRQVREIQFILYSSTGYKAYPVSRFEQHPVCNPLKCQVSLLSSETAFQVAYAEVEP